MSDRALLHSAIVGLIIASNCGSGSANPHQCRRFRIIDIAGDRAVLDPIDGFVDHEQRYTLLCAAEPACCLLAAKQFVFISAIRGVASAPDCVQISLLRW